MKRESIFNDNSWIARKGVFTTQEAESILGWRRKDLHPVLFRLVKKGKLVRIKRGLFCLVPPGAKDLKKAYPQNWFLIAKALAGESPYFISHYSAMQLHGMTTESIQTIFISLPYQQHRPKGLRIPIRFMTVPKKNFWGLEEKWITNEEKAWVSDRERTILDILDRPDLAGGISEIARGLWMMKNEIEVRKLIDYVKRFDSYAVAKRLGFLLEKLKVGLPKDIEKIRHYIRSSKAYAFLDPTLEKAGRYLDRWHLRLNFETTQLEQNLMT